MQWLRVHLEIQGTHVPSLVQEYSTCRGAAKPVHHDYWASSLEPVSGNFWSLHTLEPVLCNKRSPCNEKPMYHNEDPCSQIINKLNYINKRSDKVNWCRGRIWWKHRKMVRPGSESQQGQPGQQQQPMYKAQQLMVNSSGPRRTLTRILTLPDCVNLDTFPPRLSGDNDIMPPSLGCVRTE